MTFDAPHILTSLELAGAVTLGFVLFLGFMMLAAVPRLRLRWQASQPAQLQLAGVEPGALRTRLVDTLGRYGFRAGGAPGGPFTLEPSGLARGPGITNITVVFSPGGRATITGQARYLAMLTPDRRVGFLQEGAVPFWPWVRQRMTRPLAWLTAILFVAIFLVALNF